MTAPVDTSRRAAEAVLEAIWCDAPAPAVPVHRPIAHVYAERHARGVPSMASASTAQWSGGVRYNVKGGAL